MKYDFINKLLLFPYYFVLRVRHCLYDNSFIKSKSFSIPIISIGNITVGGTGKTPHTEFLIRELMPTEKVAVLSRGYGRKSKGFRMVSALDLAIDCGDEPLQIKRKFPDTIVAVDGKRKRGIEKLMALPEGERPSVILLDDAFQHRSVKPSTNIVLIDFNNPIDTDYLIPVGRLRDLPSQLSRADIIVVTKCPPGLDPGERFLWERRLKVSPNQKIVFTSLKYSDPVAIFEEADNRYIYSKFLILLTSVANPKPLRYHLVNSYKIESSLDFNDHHNFTKRDGRRISRWARSNPNSLIMTTEKDAQRLRSLSSLSQDVKKRLFYLPIEVTILNENGKNSLLL
ncbi:MAG TPA: tetraacyldisaccharide 4'-kinase [Bacteroidales bacterium]|nr:tetraacyldisaccharide 4'-kinase [Bacteroidales bacterium]